MNSLKILLVDDDDVDREKIRRLMSRTQLEYQLDEVSSGVDALNLMANQHYDCILMDHYLRDSLGTDLLPMLRKYSVTPCPVIMVTGCSNERGVVEAMRDGVYDYLSKTNLHVQQLRTAIEGGLLWASRQVDHMPSDTQQQHMPLFDGLTDLAGRPLFFDRLDQAVHAYQRGNLPFAVLAIDLNLFREVNESLGMAVGDQVLAQIGQRIKLMARRSDTFARLGGDDFAGILMGVATQGDVMTLVNKMSHEVRKPVVVDGRQINVSVSIGACLCPAHGMDSQALMSRAQQALQVSRQQAGAPAIYSGVPSQARTRTRLMPRQLLEAVSKHEIEMHFQPKVGFDSGGLIGVEALARWNSSQLGLVLPNDFMPAAEQSQLLVPITQVTLDLAMRQCKSWLDQGWRVPVSLNLSPRMLDDTSLAPRIIELLDAHGLEYSLFTFEIPEAGFNNRTLNAHQTLKELSQAGCGISIDDFGSGVASLRLLRDFPVSEIKIDPTYIADLRMGSKGAAIVRSLADICRELEINLVAEGVELESSWTLLNRLGCQIGQGYSIAKPMLANELPTWWQGWQAKNYRPTTILH